MLMSSSNFSAIAPSYRFTAIISISMMLLVGCQKSDKPKLVPAEGKVLYNGEPLGFGTVAFQPPRGQPARGMIRPDGTFTLSTYRPEDGVPLGHHKVRIICYSSPDQPASELVGEPSLGQLLIPRKYTFFDQSGLTAEVVQEGSKPFVFELTGPPPQGAGG